MKALFVILALIPAFCAAQVNNVVNTAGLSYTDGPPTFKPGGRGTLVAIDTVSGDWYTSTDRNGSVWVKMGDRIQKRTGCTAPVSAPAKYESTIALNSCATPELYEWNGSAWVCLTCAAGGATNLSWSQISAALYRLNSSTGNDVLFKAGTGATLSLSADTLTVAASGGAGTVQTDATIDGDGSVGDPLKIAQQSAATSEILSWTGTTWEPSWGNPYTFVTSGATITTAVNTVLIGTVGADVTIGLPTCNAANDTKRFKIIRNGSDAFSVTIDPAGSETFYDGTSTKIIYGKVALECHCRFSGSGAWFVESL